MLMNKRKLHRLVFISFLLVFSVLVLAQGTQKQEAATAGSDEAAKTLPQASGDAETGSETRLAMPLLRLVTSSSPSRNLNPQNR